MQVICGPRRCGKTTMLIRQLKCDSSNVLVVPNYLQRQQLEQDYSLTTDLTRQIIVWHNLSEYLSGIHVNKLSIDNIDMILNSLCHQSIDTITFTGSAKQLKGNR